MERLANQPCLVIGGGRVGERFAEALSKQNYLTIVYDTDSQKALNLSERWGIAYADNLTEGINQAQTVYICTPISTHFDSAARAVEAGKAVFCEKPLTGKLQEALKLQSLVHRKNTPFMVGNYYRLNSSIFALKQAVESGEIGEVISINATYLHDMRSLIEETPWRDEEGFLYDGGVHPVDLACWIAGEPVREVTAESGLRIDSHPHPIDFRINLKFQSGLLAHIWANARAILPEHGAELSILGTQGTIKAFNKDEFLWIYKEGGFLGFEQRVTPQGDLPIDRTVRIVQKFVAGELDSFYPLPSIDEAVESIRILDMVERQILKSH